MTRYYKHEQYFYKISDGVLSYRLRHIIRNCDAVWFKQSDNLTYTHEMITSDIDIVEISESEMMLELL